MTPSAAAVGSINLRYSNHALRLDLERVSELWLRLQEERDRDAIYGFLSAVFDLVTLWNVEGVSLARALRALKIYPVSTKVKLEAFSLVIFCATDPDRVDVRLRSKWARALRYAADYKPRSQPLMDFIKGEGGINACATRYAKVNR